MNRLAKDLGIPLQLDAAADALASATPAKIDVASVNDHVFLCNSVMGTTVAYSVGRARLRGRPLPERLSKYWAIIREVLSSRRKISIAVDNGLERMRLRALSVVVTNNSYDEEMPWLQRPRLDKGHLTMYVSKHQSGWGMARALVRAVLGHWHGDANVTVLKGSEFVIHSPRRRKRLANDGEVGKFATPLRYAIDQRALYVLVPRAEPRTPN
jgi:diacylglycerol kinase family enzyme